MLLLVYSSALARRAPEYGRPLCRVRSRVCVCVYLLANAASAAAKRAPGMSTGAAATATTSAGGAAAGGASTSVAGGASVGGRELLPTYPPDVTAGRREIITYLPLAPMLV